MEGGPSLARGRGEWTPGLMHGPGSLDVVDGHETSEGSRDVGHEDDVGKRREVTRGRNEGKLTLCGLAFFR